MQANQKQQGISKYAEILIRCKARQLIGKAGLTWNDVEDLEQELMLHLLERLPKFDPEVAARTTFVANIVERKISNILRDRMREKRDGRRQFGSLNDLIEDDEGETIERAYTLDQDAADIRMGRRHRTREEEARLRLDVSLLLSALPDDLRPVAQELLQKTITEAAESLGMPRTTLYYAIERLRPFFDKAGLNDYF